MKLYLDECWLGGVLGLGLGANGEVGSNWWVRRDGGKRKEKRGGHKEKSGSHNITWMSHQRLMVILTCLFNYISYGRG